jgi:putative spermidine/putrescine transport system permease protein
MRRVVVASFNVVVYLFILSPILIIIPASFNDSAFITAIPRNVSLRWYRHFLDSADLTSATLLSFRLAALTTTAAVATGLLAAIAIVQFRFPGRAAIRGLLLSPLVIPGLILGLASLIFFTRTNLAGGFISLLIAHVIVALPYSVRTISASLYGLDAMLPKAANSLGAGSVVAFRTVTLPLLKPALVASAIFCFVTSFDELVVTLFLTGPRLTTLPVEMYNYIEFTSDPTIAAISVLLILFTSAMVLMAERLVGFGDIA